MKVGVFLGSQHPPEADIRHEFEDSVAQTRAIRDAGFDSFWLGQHYLTYPNQFLQTTPLLARLAAETGDMMIGTNMILLPLHNIVDIAEQYATLDVISGGRLILGIGLGYREIEFESMGVDRKTRVPRFEEQIAALKLLWEGDDVSYEGEHVRFNNLSIRPKPLQKPRPEIWVGATADPASSARLAWPTPGPDHPCRRSARSSGNSRLPRRAQGRRPAAAQGHRPQRRGLRRRDTRKGLGRRWPVHRQEVRDLFFLGHGQEHGR